MKCGHCGLENPTGMRFCGGCGRPLDSDVPSLPREAPQRRHMTVMFCDLVESTPLAAALDPEDFREVLTDYRQACLRAVERFGGYTAVYAGDGMTVYFGYPRAHEDDAQRAVHTGLAILDGIEDLNGRLRDLYDISIQVRMGVHSGVVIAEELGGGAGETRSQLDISGEMPHIASRLESIAPPGSVVISDATRALVEGWFETEPLGQKDLKGVARPMHVYRIVGATGAVGRLEVAAARRLTPVVGRAAELAQLADAWRQASTGRGLAVHVAGEAGIGKSRLVHELAEAVHQSAVVERWQCSAHHSSTSLYPVTTFLERLLGLSRGDSTEHRLEELGRAVALAGHEPDEAVPLLADLLAIPIPAASGHGLTPRDARTALLRVLESLLVTNPARHPLLLVVEDLHWADPTTVELLGRIIRGLPGHPVLCVLTFRADFEPPWTQEQPGLWIELDRLSADEVRSMATAASGGELESSVLEWVESTAGGVPLFVEEMLKLGRDESATGVPPTLEGLLTERLDRLPELGEVIDVAAVLGREFDRSLLGALTPVHGDFELAMAQLATQDVLRPVDGAPARVEFTHGLLQDAAYARMLRRRRRELHARVADTLVTDFGDTVEREPEVVARHWSSAGEPARAVAFWRAAGARALDRAAYLEAAEHFRRGLEALDASDPRRADDLEHVEFLTHIAASLQAGRGYAAAGVDEAYARARKACEGGIGDERLASVIRGQWMFHLLRGEYGTTRERADEMLALGERSGQATPVAEGHLDRGLVHMYLGEFELARDHLAEAVARYQKPTHADHIYEAQGDTGVGALAYLAVVLWNLGYPDEAQECSDESLARATQVGGPVTRAQAWGMRSILHLTRAEPVELGQWIHRTHAHSVDHDLGYWRAVSALLSSWLQGRAGAVELGTARFRESLDAYLASGSRLGLPYFYMLFADLRRVAGDRRGALDLIQAGEDYIAETGERYSESELYRFKGRLLMSGDAPDADGATAAFERGVAAARDQNAKLLELQAATRLADHLQRIGQTSPMLGRVAALCDWFGPASQLVDVERARALVASGTIAR
jgi:class 3 adenylate cyclase/predicted ATPase